MKSIELLPTDKNILNTLVEYPFNRNEEISSFLELLTTIEGHFVISIDGQWESGKTFFVKQCELILNSINGYAPDNETEEKILHLSFLKKKELLKKLKNQTCVYFDAWANDEYENPIIAILQTLIDKETFSEKIFSKETIVKVKKIIENINKAVISKRTGINLDKIEENLSCTKDEKGEQQKNLHNSITEVIKALTKDGQRLVIFIDELDRCNPRFAVKLLEQIKHYFLIDNVTFVITTNISELSKTICKFYGENFEGNKYLVRFFDLSLRLSLINPKEYYSYIASTNQDYVFEKYKLDVINFLNMSMRSIGRFAINNELIDYKKFKESFSIWSPSTETIYLNIEWAIVPLLIGLRLTNKEKELSFLMGNEVELFKQFMLSSETFWSIFRFEENHRELNRLCEISNEKIDSNYKEKVIKTIYSKCFVNTYYKDYRSDDYTDFWYSIRRQIEKTLYLD